MLRNVGSPAIAIQRRLQTSITSVLSSRSLTSSAGSSSSTAPSSATKSVVSERYDKLVDARLNGKKFPYQAKNSLLPYTLSQRLKEQCEAGNYGVAIDMLKTSPADAQNVIVWNGLIHRLMHARKYKASYQMYVQVCDLVLYYKMNTAITLLLDETSWVPAQRQDVCHTPGWSRLHLRLQLSFHPARECSQALQ